MGHLIDQPASPLQRSIQRAQRTIAIAVVGCAALALWSAPASAAETAAPDIGGSAAQSQPLPVSAPVPQSVADTAGVATDASQALTDTAPAVPNLPVKAPSVPRATVPASAPQVPASVPSATVSDAVHTASSHTPAVDTAAATSGITKTSSGPPIQIPGPTDVSGASGSVSNLAGGPSASDQPPSGPSGRALHRALNPPRSQAPGVISVSVRHVRQPMLANIGAPPRLLTSSTPDSSGSSSATLPAAGSSHPDFPGLPGPLQIPVLGSGGSPTTSSSSYFFFGFAGLLVGLWAAFAPALSRRLQGSPASWRPAPYLSLLELPG
jgi:hypothetical protein